jgi:F-type H+-transporting ATPase subunit alpha
MQSFAQFGSDLDARTRQLLNQGARIVELFKQPQLEPKAAEMEVFLLFAVIGGHLDGVAVDKTHGAVRKLEEWLATNQRSLLAEIAASGALDDSLEKKMATALGRWKCSSGTEFQAAA